MKLQTRRLDYGFVGQTAMVQVNNTWYPAIKTMNLKQAKQLRDELEVAIQYLEKENAS